MKDRRLALPLIGIGLVAAFAQLYATAPGIGTTPDSRYYVEAANRLYETGSLTTTAEGVVAPLVHFPPALSMTLSLGRGLAVDPLAADRWLNGAALFATVALTALLILRLSGSRWLAILGAAAAGSSSALFGVFLYAWSEPLFIPLLLAGFAIMSVDMPRPRRLAAAGLCFGLAWVTRYIGGAFVASVMLWLVLQPGRRWSRLGRAALFCAVSGAPFAAWSLRNALLTGQPTNRTLNITPIPAATVIGALGTGFVGGLVCVAVFLAIAIALKVNVRQTWHHIQQRPVIACLWLSLAIYGASLIASIAFVDASTPLDDRILSPALAILIIAALSTLGHMPLPDGPRLRLAVFAAGAAYFALAILGTARLVIRAHQDGLGYTSRTWRSSATVAYVQALPADVPIYSNGYDAIYLLTGRSTFPLPLKPDGIAQSVPAYNREIDTMRSAVTFGHGVVVIFSTIQRPYLAAKDDVDQLLPSLTEKTLADGVILNASQ